MQVQASADSRQPLLLVPSDFAARPRLGQLRATHHRRRRTNSRPQPPASASSGLPAMVSEGVLLILPCADPGFRSACAADGMDSRWAFKQVDVNVQTKMQQQRQPCLHRTLSSPAARKPRAGPKPRQDGNASPAGSKRNGRLGEELWWEDRGHLQVDDRDDGLRRIATVGTFGQQGNDFGRELGGKGMARKSSFRSTCASHSTACSFRTGLLPETRDDPFEHGAGPVPGADSPKSRKGGFLRSLFRRSTDGLARQQDGPGQPGSHTPNGSKAGLALTRVFTRSSCPSPGHVHPAPA